MKQLTTSRQANLSGQFRPTTFTVPAGIYYLGDPCYTLGDEGWDAVLALSNYFKRPYEQDGCISVAFLTAYGDGVFADQFGNEYPVDAGVIGLVPVGMATRKHRRGLVRRVQFTQPTVCINENGLLKFGNIEIETDPSRRRLRSA